MKIKPADYLVRENATVHLNRVPTETAPFYSSKDEYKRLLADQVKAAAHQQALLYAHNRYSLLLIFQAMDTAGKDGAIKHVMSGIDPAGCQVHSFKKPSDEELEHDFLWRAYKALPERGRIGIFNRSYYEEVLIVRVHLDYLKNQNLPDELLNARNIWAGRYESIRNFEQHLYRNGTRILKFFLHLSPQEQAKRILERIDDPEKNWKANPADVQERRYWKDYMRAYEQCLRETSSKQAPWYIVPADDKKNSRLIISTIVLETLKSLPMEFPRATAKHLADLRKMRAALTRELRST